VEAIVCPRLLEHESEIPAIEAFFDGKSLDALCLIPGNFTLDHVMPLAAQALGLPTLLWGLPTRQAWGALVAVQQTVLPFKELRLPYRFVVSRLEDARVWDRVMPFLRAAALLRRLRGSRIGVMGWRAEGMSDATFDELALRETFGVQVVNLGLTRYSRTMVALPDAEVEAAWAEARPRYRTEALPDDVGRHGIRSYLAMKRLVAEEGLDAVTMECFHDHLGTPCLGFSMFNDQGTAAPCENDVMAAIVMMAGQMLTGEPTFHTDIVEADLTEGTAILHHCGNMPHRLAADERPILRPIRPNVGPGAFGPTIQTTMRAGPVTAVNLVGRRGSLRLAALEGTAIGHATDMPGSGAKVRYDGDLEKVLEALGNAGYGHHFALVQGHVRREMAEWCGLVGIECFRG
jgi:L-arabinose isomerase